MKVHTIITKDLLIGWKAWDTDTACEQNLGPQERRGQRDSSHEARRSFTKLGSGSQDSAHSVSVMGGLVAPPREINSHMWAGRLRSGRAGKAPFPTLLPLGLGPPVVSPPAQLLGVWQCLMRRIFGWALGGLWEAGTRPGESQRMASATLSGLGTHDVMLHWGPRKTSLLLMLPSQQPGAALPIAGCSG